MLALLLGEAVFTQFLGGDFKALGFPLVNVAGERLAHLIAAYQIGNDDKSFFGKKIGLAQGLPCDADGGARGGEVVGFRTLGDVAENLKDARLERKDGGERILGNVGLLEKFILLPAIVVVAGNEARCLQR